MRRVLVGLGMTDGSRVDTRVMHGVGRTTPYTSTCMKLVLVSRRCWHPPRLAASGPRTRNATSPLRSRGVDLNSNATRATRELIDGYEGGDGHLSRRDGRETDVYPEIPTRSSPNSLEPRIPTEFISFRERWKSQQAEA